MAPIEAILGVAVWICVSQTTALAWSDVAESHGARGCFHEKGWWDECGDGKATWGAVSMVGGK